ncbi:ankyrin repeat-containing domain protein [Phialemonium atrogriseum]|uniref:Ankyrin repeat-containing domain protein n=1 Tax=Phialemonium atrogriseum TaxID=1093897 RepID=A0AAJ0FR54_9PEZI|nr:ankyrin repeat-containing domain protein [Phialemonium atrogriseum]KAK1772049.1 ankyrin repeat-containing domain protein [Phialemonium atrogriseum]
MLLIDLPVELLTYILDPLVPDGWNNSTARPKLLDLRLVCSRFDDVVSRQAFQKLDQAHLRERFSRVREESFGWFLATKVKIDRGIYMGPTANLWMSVQSIAFWKACNSEATGEEEYLNAACDMLVTYHGREWVCQELLSSDRDLIAQSPPKTEGSEDGDEESSLLRHRAIEDMVSSSSLQVAAYYGDKSIVETLLASGADPNKPSDHFPCALLAACYNGHTIIARLLVDHGADPEERGRITPLEAATGHGHVATMEFLLRRGVHKNNTDIPTKCLVTASEAGYEEAVELLLRLSDVDINTNSTGETPLLLAARNGHREVVRLLLSRHDVHANASDAQGHTPLWWATSHGWIDIVHLVLARPGVRHPNPRTKGAETSLTTAVFRGYGEIVRLLIELGGVQPRFRSGNGMCPLFISSFRGYGDVVRHLLKRYDAQLNEHGYDEHLGKLLTIAAIKGHESVVLPLLVRHDVDFNTEDERGLTPLSKAVCNDHISVVQLLLSRNDVDPNAPWNGEERPLRYAASQGNMAMVRLLLTRSDIDPNLSGNGGTPLWQAARLGYPDVVRLLLERVGVDPNVASEGHSRISRSPVRNKEAHLDKTYRFEWTVQSAGLDTPLCVASWRGQEAVVELLLEDRRVKPNLPDIRRRSPLWWASFGGNTGIVSLLLGHRSIDPNLHDNRRWTPLSVAVSEGHDEVVELLLEHANTDPNFANEDGWTPLLMAANDGHEGIVERLLQHPAIDADVRLDPRTTALVLALQRGHDRVARLLVEHDLGTWPVERVFKGTERASGGGN